MSKAAGFTEIEQHGPCIVQQGEDARRAVGGDQVQIGHAPPEQRVPLSEVVVDVEPGQHAGDRFRGSSMPSSSVMVSRNAVGAVVGASTRLRQGVLLHAGADRMALGLVRVQAGRPVRCP